MNKKKLVEMRQKLDEIASRNGGVLCPRDVVREAKKKSSILHCCFTWDIHKAANEHWLYQARVLIASVRYEYTVEERSYSSPKWVRDPRQSEKQQGYVSVTKICTDREVSRDMLLNEFSRAGAHLIRAYEIARALNFREDDVRTVVDGVTQLISHVEVTESASLGHG